MTRFPLISHWSLPFNSHQLAAAAKEWGCNCGPSALAAAMNCSLLSACNAIPAFHEKRYTSPTMMRAAVEKLGATIIDLETFKTSPNFRLPLPPPTRPPASPPCTLVRIQWCGPWTAPDANPRWAYLHTHWIALKRCGQVRDDSALVFDVNAGVTTVNEWGKHVAPWIMQHVKRCDGKWFATHNWLIASRMQS